MNILIDYSQLPIQKVGVGVYGLNFLWNLKPEVGIKYFILIQDDDDSLDSLESSSFLLLRVNASRFRKLIYRFYLEQVYIPYLVYKYKIDLVHSLHYSFPIMHRAKKIVTVCDMTFFKYPELHLKSKVLYFRLFIRLSTFLADKVICISNSTLLDYINKFNVSDKFAVVVELGKDERFKPDISTFQIDTVLHKYGINDGYILFIGTIEPRKNIRNLILSFAQLADEFNSLSLVIVGKKGWYYESTFRLVKELHLESRVIFTGFILEDEKPALLVGARMFVYPSIYEGFGIPVLESLACGTPTITSNVSSMPEVAGDAAILVNPSNVNEINAAMMKLLKDKNFCEDLRIKGPLQASKFTWQTTSNKTISVYKSVISPT